MRDEREVELLLGVEDVLTGLGEDAFPTSASVFPPLKSFGKAAKVKMPRLMGLVRGVLTGSAEGPPVGELVQILGTRESLKRLREARVRMNK